MKQFALLFAACAVAFAGQAQISITSSSLTYSQDFDALDTTVFSSSGFHGSANLPNGWAIFEYGSSTTRKGNDYVGDDGGSTAGDAYSYGTRDSLERALGSIASTSLKPHFGASFVNNTGTAITGFTIRYRGEQWRLGNASRVNLADSLIFYYSTSADSVADTAAAKWTVDTGLTLTTINGSGTAGKMNGNAAGNNAIRTAFINAAIPNGGMLVIRWADLDISGADDGLAIDSFSIQFQMANTNRPVLVSHTPLSNAMGVPANTTLTMTFDKQITAGSGSIYLTNEILHSTTTIPANSASVIISGNTATVTPSMPLELLTTYHVTFDSTAFDTASFHSYGLYDTTTWKFQVQPESVGSFRAGALPLQVVNPAVNGSFELSCVLGRAAVLHVQVIDLNGRMVAAQSVRAQQGENRFLINASLPAGTYIIRVDDGSDWGSVKAVMQ